MDIAKLAIEVDASQATAAAKQLQTLQTAAGKTEVATTKANGSFRMAGNGVQQMGYQVQDIAVQLGAGTSPFIVLAQQGSQVASIFGPGGAVIGALLAVSGAIAGSLVSSLMGASTATDDLVAELDALDGSFDVAADGSYKLSEELVRLARISEKAAKLKVAVETEQARKSILSLGIAIKEQSDELIGSTKLSVEEQKKLRDAISATVQSTDVAAYENLAAVVSELDSKYREATDAARENLKATSSAARQAGLTGEQQFKLGNAANAARRKYLALNGTMGTATAELAKYVEAGLKAADIYNRLVDGGTDWEGLLKRTNKTMADNMNFGPSSADYYDEQLRLLKEAEAEQLRADSARLASRASALKAIEALEVQQMSQQERLTDNYLTQQYQIAAALGAGVIAVEEANALKLASDQQYATASRQITDQQTQAQLAAYATTISAMRGFSDAALAAVEAYGEESSDLGRGLLLASKVLTVAQAVMAAELSAVMTRAAYASAAMFAGPAAPGVIAAGEAAAQINRGLGYASAALIAATEFAPARALGGQVTAGTTYLVGERGPELVTMGANGYVTPNDKLQGSNQTVVLQISTGVSQAVRAEMAAMMPGIVKMIGQATGGRRR